MRGFFMTIGVCQFGMWVIDLCFGAYCALSGLPLPVGLHKPIFAIFGYYVFGGTP